MKKVMIFGVFDGIHEGHRAVLKEAKTHGDFLIVVVAQDHVVEHLKGRLPEVNLIERFDHLKDEDGVDKVVIGDASIGTWNVINKYEPDVVALGYDQESLRVSLIANLKNFNKEPEIAVLESYEPNTYHSSIINGRK